ncbi:MULTISPECIES: type II and III secretion system protein family protein [unclassified Paraburkholderia]|uniref:type II and III secretion system protein family protein n=1 Tax=unclassified Paraburkholderia TaxID=2615204 RepID=UPI001612442D|nr:MULTISPECIES: type II and III secretion system protein family protein [unclassified Paraburkholderia]MBB5448166.1 pilus assembly protein CpaC [Paraburkholderia sp. WSM4177]MBB5488564.1 pilus assembly protein CpaC [Paraburkholderia sp. WSM4180]
MKTKPGFSRGSKKHRCSLGSKALAAILCFGLVGTQSAEAQEAIEYPALAKRGATPPLPAGRNAKPMMIAMGTMPAGAAGAAGAGMSGPLPLRGPSCTGEIRDESTVTVPVGKSILVPLIEPTRNRTLGNPAIVQATLVSPRTLYVVGMAVGTTNMIVQGRSGACQMINVIVNIDANGLQQALGQLLPDERGIRVSTAAGNLVLGGQVSSAPAAQQAMQIAQAFADSQPTQQQQAASSNSGNGMPSISQQSSSTSKPASVINMMSVDSPQQVMLEVKVAEVSKTLINQLGAAVNIQGGFGSWTGALVSNLLAGVSSALAISKANNRPFNLAVDAQKTDNLVKILAEPNLVTISGQEATFLSGGKIFIPIPQSSGNGVSSITLQEEEFGVGLKFTPTVLSGGRISLKVAPEVSELSPTGVTVSSTNVNGVSILPLINTRRASTVVQMHDGESFAIGGLLSSNVTGALKAVPGLGEVPVLGALLRSTSFQQDLTELVFVITPHLVKPMQTTNYPLPTDSFSQPNVADVYATGNMEGRHGRTSVAPVGTEPGNAPTPTPVPAPAPQAPAAPAANALPPHDTQATSSAPAQPATSGAAAPPEKARPSAQPSAQNPMTDERAPQIARIESAARQIAAHEAQQDVANTDASGHALDH